ncbi:sugar diacid recognition domain-containing protein [Mycoplasmatota bacterium WC44]
MIGLEKNILIDMAVRLSKLIKHNVNIFNVEGIIVGSSDMTRIGEYHELAHNIILGKVKEYKVYDSSSENVRPGINLPIHSEKKIIGAVGVTGNPDDVGIFSEILKLSLESLISQQLVEDKKLVIRKYEKQVVLDIIFDLSQKENINKRLNILEFRKKQHYIVIKFDSHKYDFDKLLNGVDHLKGTMNEEIVFIATSDDEKNLKDICDRISKTKCRAIFSRIIPFNRISSEYKVINYIEQFHLSNNKRTYYCGDYILDCFFYNLKNTEYDIMKHFNEAENLQGNQVMIDTFNMYVKNNLSIVDTAKELFVHVNTLKYRIKRIEELTSCSLKNIDDLIKLKLSILYIRDK